MQKNYFFYFCSARWYSFFCVLYLVRYNPGWFMFKITFEQISAVVRTSVGRKLYFAGKVMLGFFLIGMLIKYSGVKIQQFAGMDWRFVAGAGAVLLLQNVFVALRWWLLLRSLNIKITFFTALSLTMQGLFYMLFLPGGTVSADLCKAALTAGKSADGRRFDAAFTVVLDRVCGLAGLLILSFFAVFYYWSYAQYPLIGEVWWLLKAVVIFAPAMLILIYGAFHCNKLLKFAWVKRVYDWCNLWSKDFFRKIVENLAACQCAKRAVIGCILFSAFVTFPLIILSVYLIGSSFAGSSSAIWYGSVLSGSAGELSGLLPLTPGAVGVRDAVFAQCFKACGLGKEAAAVIPLVFTAVMYMTGSFGVLFALPMLFGRKRRK